MDGVSTTGQACQPSLLNLADHGAAYYPQLAHQYLPQLTQIFDSLQNMKGGVRLESMVELQQICADSGPVMQIAKQYLGLQARAVRAVVFDKNAQYNWALGWHQDRTIAVKSRPEDPSQMTRQGFHGWSVKQGLVHVIPPFQILENMLTMRIHLDRVDQDNAPLRIAAGSHKMGMITENHIDDIVSNCVQYSCLAEPGDAWLYAMPILHASQSAKRVASRRVLQLYFSNQTLPGSLDWLGI